MLMVILLYFSLKVADISLSKSGHLVPWWLTPNRITTFSGLQAKRSQATKIAPIL
jgi:hypothetical protein